MQVGLMRVRRSSPHLTRPCERTLRILRGAARLALCCEPRRVGRDMPVGLLLVSPECPDVDNCRRPSDGQYPDQRTRLKNPDFDRRLALLVSVVLAVLPTPAHGRQQPAAAGSFVTRDEREAFLAKARFATDSPTDDRPSWRAVSTMERGSTMRRSSPQTAADRRGGTTDSTWPPTSWTSCSA